MYCFPCIDNVKKRLNINEGFTSDHNRESYLLCVITAIGKASPNSSSVRLSVSQVQDLRDRLDTMLVDHKKMKMVHMLTK